MKGEDKERGLRERGEGREENDGGREEIKGLFRWKGRRKMGGEGQGRKREWGKQ